MAARTEKTEPVTVCLDSDVIIAGLFSTSGASHALMLLGEIGILRLVLSEESVAEIKRNLEKKLPDALPLFARFLDAIAVDVYRAKSGARTPTRGSADGKDLHVLAAAEGCGTRFLVTHNVRHYQAREPLQVVRPGELLELIRGSMAALAGH